MARAKVPVIDRCYFGPPDWVAGALTARQRRAAAFWLLILYVVTTPLRYPFKDVVWMVWLLSEFAIVISLLTFVSAETPVEQE